MVPRLVWWLNNVTEVTQFIFWHPEPLAFHLYVCHLWSQMAVPVFSIFTCSSQEYEGTPAQSPLILPPEAIVLSRTFQAGILYVLRVQTWAVWQGPEPLLWETREDGTGNGLGRPLTVSISQSVVRTNEVMCEKHWHVSTQSAAATIISRTNNSFKKS